MTMPASFRRFCLLLLAATTLAPIAASAAKAKAAPLYKGFIVVDAATGNTLAQENPDNVSPPASVTKLMTFLIVHDRIKAGALSLQTQVPVTARASKMGGTQVWLKEGESFSVEDLLYALLVQSANDAAQALAEAAAGSREAFVELMNARARALGMKNTTFRTPHGLPPPNRKTSEGDLTSPRDLTLLARELITTTDILTYTSVRERPFRPDAAEPVIMRNHNKLLGDVAGVDGLKTGFTNGAGFCLVATAERNGRRIIVAIMGSPSAATRDEKVRELLERGFIALPPATNPISPATSAVRPSEAPPTKRPPAGSPIAPIAPVEAAPSPSAQDPAPVVKFPPPKKR